MKIRLRHLMLVLFVGVAWAGIVHALENAGSPELWQTESGAADSASVSEFERPRG